MPDPSRHHDPIQIYADRLARLTADHDAIHRRWSLIGNIRLVLIVVAGVAGWQWWGERAPGWLWTAVAAVVAYLALVIVQRSLRERRDHARRLVAVHERAIARVEQRWNDLPGPPDSGAGRDHPYAWDLNVVGRASLVQRVGTPVTRYGWDMLHQALLTEHDPANLEERQVAVGELAGALDLRHAVEAAGLREDETLPDPDALVRWASGEPWLRQRPILRLLAWIGPMTFLTLAALWAAGSVQAAWMIVPVLFNALVFTLWAGPAARRVQEIVPLREAISGYRDIFGTIASDRPRGALLRRINDALEGEADGAMPRTGALSRLVSLSIPPGALVYFPLQITLMWDVHVLELLEAWQARSGRRVRGWLQAAGEWEALAALSVLRHDHPGWAFPAVCDDEDTFRARQLAHPLLAPAEAVANDVEVGPVGHFLFVTGSNMSGKSTLLRAIGANAVLAQAGAPVATEALTMPPLRVSSLMRVEDSLERGVSFFMAELQRLKAVVENVNADSSRMALYLLDEILQGTNTGERQVASRQVLRSLSKAYAIGAISSHDLELIQSTDLERAAVPVHFAEVFSRDGDIPTMTFDYRLRPGLATSSNALALMEMLGFDVGEVSRPQP